jgi:threonyl-tRNA synthetase
MAIKITLLDGSVREVSSPLSCAEFAMGISKSLARQAVAVKSNGVLKDLASLLDRDCAIEVITRDSKEGHDILRHSAAHVMAEAVQELFPEAQATIGPVIENGFYYDFARETPFSHDDLEQIEQRMLEIVDRDEKILREIWSREKAMAYFREKGESYKVELIEGIPADQEISVYRQGGWLDLCRGPHLPSTSMLGKAFKVMKVAGAYWRGQSGNVMLQRIYGTAFASDKNLQDHLHALAESERRDHRLLGRELDLFHLQEEAHGSVFWHPKGYTVWQALEQYLRRRIRKAGYVEVKTPQVCDVKFWRQSGHWGKYRRNMFIVPDEVPSVDDAEPLVSGKAKLMALKPMNCPAHVQIFKQAGHEELPGLAVAHGRVWMLSP